MDAQPTRDERGGPDDAEQRRELLDLRRRVRRLERNQADIRIVVGLLFIMLLVPGLRGLAFLVLVLGGLLWIGIRMAVALERWTRGPDLFQQRQLGQARRAARRTTRRRRADATRAGRSSTVR